MSTQLLAPIAPHTCEHVWRNLLQRPGSVLTSGWPEAPLPDVKLKAMETYLTRTVKALRDAADKAVLPPKAKKGKAPPPHPPPGTPLPGLLSAVQLAACSLHLASEL